MLQTILQRARRATASNTGYTDDEGSKPGTAMDVGHFLSEFETMCKPAAGSSLAEALTSARTKYENTKKYFQFGPGTNPQTTGLHAFFAPKKVVISEISKYGMSYVYPAADYQA